MLAGAQPIQELAVKGVMGIRMTISISIGNKIRLLIGVALTALVVLSGFALVLERNSMFEDRKLKTRNLVEVAYGVVEHFGKLAQSGKLDEKQAQDMAKAALAHLRYQGDDYFWVNDMGPRMVMHPVKPELNGKDLSDFKDPEGKHLFVDMVMLVTKSGAGFVEYRWPKPGQSAPLPKISYVKGFAPWGWVIGSGIYVDDVEAAFRRHLALFGAGIALLALALAGISWWVLRSITRPLEVLRATMTQVAASGDLRASVTLDDKHELGQIAEAFSL